jgi:hypothetical protein
MLVHEETVDTVSFELLSIILVAHWLSWNFNIEHRLWSLNFDVLLADSILNLSFLSVLSLQSC